MRRAVAVMVVGALTLLILFTGWHWRETMTCRWIVPQADPAEDGPSRLIPSKVRVRAGEEITITIESRHSGTISRGIDSYLECWDGRDWVTKYLLVTPHQSGMKPSSHPYPFEGAIISIGLIGPGPERIRLPGNLRPGWYRLRKEFYLEDEKSSISQTAYARLRVVP